MNWPVIQLQPTPSDTELEAERDAKHAVAVRHFFQQEREAEMKRHLAAIAALATVTAPAANASPPIVGGNGLRPNAWALADYIRDTYPGVQSIGGVRADKLPDHPSGHALDLMVGGNTALGNQIAADIRNQSGRFGVRYLLWQVERHFDHIHVTVN